MPKALSRFVHAAIHLVALSSFLNFFGACKYFGDAPNRRLARRAAMKKAAVDGSVFKSNRLADTSVDKDIAAATDSKDGEPIKVDPAQPGDVVSDDGGFIPEIAASSAADPNGSDAKGGKTDILPEETEKGKGVDCGNKVAQMPAQSGLKKDGECGASKDSNTNATQKGGTPSTPTNPPTNPYPATTTSNSTIQSTPPSTLPSQPNVSETPPVQQQSTIDPSVTVSQNQMPPPAPKESCNMFVHLRGHKPEWSAVFIPARPMAAGRKDDVLAGIAKLRVPKCAWPAQLECIKENHTYVLGSKRQPGSPDCQVVFSQNYSPLIIDMLGRGILLTHPQDGVRFDIEGHGEKMLISWPIDVANSPFLVLDTNNNGNIDSVHELFGNNTKGPDGNTANNGFLALAKYDLNRDKVINGRDTIWQRLRFWRDLNRNGLTDPGELSTLAQNRIVSIDLDYVEKQENADPYGNSTLQRSVVEMRSGKMRNIFDLWFAPGLE